MKAVITADIIDYTNLSNKNADLVLRTIHRLFDSLKWVRTNLESNLSITRGDNIQIEIDNPVEALRIALLLKTAVNKIAVYQGNKISPGIDIRIAIGIGSVKASRESVNESSGDAYTFSGRTLDSMKKNKRLFAIKTYNPGLDAELETEFQLLEVIMSGWKVTSAEVIFSTLAGSNENRIAEELNISQSAINQRKKTAGWSGIEALLERFNELIKSEENK